MKKVLIEERLGTVIRNKFGSLMVVEKYQDGENIFVNFPEFNHSVKTRWYDFLKGKVRSPYERTHYKVGYLGEGKYKTNMTVDGKHRHTPQYSTWIGMLKRCYDEKYHQKFPSYIGCSVTPEWHNFQTFAAWYDENYYEIEGDHIELDKDILIKGNKIYSPETCIFTPKKINYLFIKNNSKRGNLPLGVYRHTETRKYIANCGNGNSKRINLGSYSTPERAFEAYKEYKEKLIKHTAEEYMGKIPEKLYNAMMNYIVEITD